jgi:hypothetical protein
MKSIHIIGGGTTFSVRPHLEIAAKAYGQTARYLQILCGQAWGDEEAEIQVHLTRMANSGQGTIETNSDVAKLLKHLIGEPSTSVIFMPVALCDFEGSIMENALATPSGKNEPRLKSRSGDQMMLLTPAAKLISEIRKYRKDIFLVGFKTTASATPDEQYFAGLELVKQASCNLVLANDLHTKLNMVVTPEQSRYYVTTRRYDALGGLVSMTRSRSKLHFTRSTVVRGEAVPWNSPAIAQSLRTVVDYCISKGAYKPFLGTTNGHFAVRQADGSILTSIRKTNFNNLKDIGMVKIETHGQDEVVAYGYKPSVGGQSQRYIFAQLPEADCIVHFHCPLKVNSKVPIRSQENFECGSHECGRNTSQGLAKFGNLWAVMLDQHGPNVVFHSSIDPGEVIRFIEENFDLQGRTDGVEIPTPIVNQVSI